MNLNQDALALAGASAAVDPHGWTTVIAATAPALAACTVTIVIVLCMTVVVLVKSTEPSQRLAAIKALVPILLALASRLTAWLATWGKS